MQQCYKSITDERGDAGISFSRTYVMLIEPAKLAGIHVTKIRYYRESPRNVKQGIVRRYRETSKFHAR